MSKYPKNYLVLAFDTYAEDILLFHIREVLSPGAAKQAVLKEYEANNWGKPDRLRVINLASGGKSGFLGGARVYDLPRPK